MTKKRKEKKMTNCNSKTHWTLRVQVSKNTFREDGEIQLGRMEKYNQVGLKNKFNCGGWSKNHMQQKILNIL